MMGLRKLYYLRHNGKNSNLLYFLKAYIREYSPKCFIRWMLNDELKKIDQREDRDYILKRADYYCKLTPDSQYNRQEWEKEAVEISHQPMTRQKVYYFDAMEIARYFNGKLKWILLSGDITHVPNVPTIIKSRPLVENNQNSVVLKMEKVRHFLFVDDQKPWRNKKNVAIFRGDLGARKQNRDVFMERFANGQSPMVDAASTSVRFIPK